MTTVIAIDDIESFFSHAEGAAKAELKMFLDDFNDYSNDFGFYLSTGFSTLLRFNISRIALRRSAPFVCFILSRRFLICSLPTINISESLPG